MFVVEVKRSRGSAGTDMFEAGIGQAIDKKGLHQPYDEASLIILMMDDRFIRLTMKSPSSLLRRG